MRDIFERALTAIGQHAALGNIIWDAYREFEQNLLDAMDPAAHTATEIMAAKTRVYRLFHRQLALPLLGI